MSSQNQYLELTSCERVPATGVNQNCPVVFFVPGSGHGAPPDDYSLRFTCTNDPGTLAVDVNDCNVADNGDGSFDVNCCLGVNQVDINGFICDCVTGFGEVLIEIVHDADGHTSDPINTSDFRVCNPICES
jgi:hypothetical protein